MNRNQKKQVKEKRRKARLSKKNISEMMDYSPNEILASELMKFGFEELEDIDLSKFGISNKTHYILELNEESNQEKKRVNFGKLPVVSSKIDDEGGKMNSLECICGGELILSRSDYIKKYGTKMRTIKNSMILTCKLCNKRYNEDYLDEFIKDSLLLPSSNLAISSEVVDKSIKGIYLKYSIFSDNKISFLFSEYDYYLFPGLTALAYDGFLTPVYFKFDVLLKYKYDPKYEVRISSSSYSSIRCEDFGIHFGLNTNNRVIMWLGDIVKLPIDEQYYLRSFNIESDHHLRSEFYAGQIEVVWPEKSNEQRLFEAKKKVFENIKIKYDFEIMTYFDETDKIFYTINKPIYKSRKAFDNEIIDLNKVFVKSIWVKSLRNYLKAFGIKDIDKLGSLALLKKFVIKEFGFNDDTAFDLLSSLFVLSGLRNCAGHLKNQKEYEDEFNTGMKLLGLNENCSDYLLIYDTLIIKLMTTFEKLIDMTA